MGAALLKALAVFQAGRHSGLLMGWVAQREAAAADGLVKRMWVKGASAPITTENAPWQWNPALLCRPSQGRTENGPAASRALACSCAGMVMQPSDRGPF